MEIKFIGAIMIGLVVLVVSILIIEALGYDIKVNFLKKIKSEFSQLYSQIFGKDYYNICEVYDDEYISFNDFGTLLNAMYNQKCGDKRINVILSFSVREKDIIEISEEFGIAKGGELIHYGPSDDILGLGVIIIDTEIHDGFLFKFQDNITLWTEGIPDKDLFLNLTGVNCDIYQENCLSRDDYVSSSNILPTSTTINTMSSTTTETTSSTTITTIFAPVSNLPECDENNPEVKIIYSNEDFLDINNPEYRIFCVTPGTYNGLELTRDGSEERPRYMIYYNPDSPNTEIPPWDQPQDNRVIFRERTEIESGYWFIHGVTFDHDGYYAQVSLNDNSRYVTLDQVLFQNGIDMIRLRGGDHHILQNSVLRNSWRRTDPDDDPNNEDGPLDSHCILIQRSQYSRIKNNEIYNCAGDGIQFHGGHGNTNNPKGTIINNNEFYIDSSLYADCDNLDPHDSLDEDGECACAESAISMKSLNYDQDASTITEIKNNIMYGFRNTHETCGGTGTFGLATSFSHGDSTCYAIFEQNVIFDSTAGIQVQNVHHHTIRNNLFYDIYDRRYQDEMWVLNFIFGNNVEFYHNTIVGTGNADYYLRHSSTANNYDIRNNLFVLSGEEEGRDHGNDNFDESNHVDYNAFYETEEFSNGVSTSHNMGGTNVPISEAHLSGEYCFTINKHTNPHEHCIPNIIPTENSPFVNQGDPNVGSRVDIGIDNELGVDTDLRGHTRDNQPDIGAFEFR